MNPRRRSVLVLTFAFLALHADDPSGFAATPRTPTLGLPSSLLLDADERACLAALSKNVVSTDEREAADKIGQSMTCVSQQHVTDYLVGRLRTSDATGRTDIRECLRQRFLAATWSEVNELFRSDLDPDMALRQAWFDPYRATCGAAPSPAPFTKQASDGAPAANVTATPPSPQSTPSPSDAGLLADVGFIAFPRLNSNQLMVRWNAASRRSSRFAAAVPTGLPPTAGVVDHFIGPNVRLTISEEHGEATAMSVIMRAPSVNAAAVSEALGLLAWTLEGRERASSVRRAFSIESLFAAGSGRQERRVSHGQYAVLLDEQASRVILTVGWS